MTTTATIYPAAASGWTNSSFATQVGGGVASADTTRTFDPGTGKYIIVPTPNLLCSPFTGIAAGVGAGDTIQGVQVEIGLSSLNTGAIGSLYLARAGVIVGNVKGINMTSGGTYGGAADLWGSTSWTGANLASLQVVFFAIQGTGSTNTISVDYIRVTVTYAASTPAAFSFTDVTGATQSTQYISDTVTVSGLGAGVSVPVTITSTGLVYSYEKNASGSFTTAPGTAVNGDSFRVRATSSASAGATYDTTLTIGGVYDTYSITNSAVSGTPSAFSWATQYNCAVSSRIYSADYVIVAGINSPVAISISGGSGTYSKNGGPYTSAPGTVVAGDRIGVSGLSSAAYGVGVTVSVTIGGVLGTFVINTTAFNGNPTPFIFNAVTGAATSTVYTSNTVTIGGLGPSGTIAQVTVAGGSAYQYQLNGGPWVNNTGTINLLNGLSLALRMTSPGSALANASYTVKVGFTFTTWSISTGADVVCNAFTFTDVTSVNGLLNTSNTVTIGGLTPATSVAVTCVGGEIQVNAGSWTTQTTLVNGDTLKARGYASLVPGGVTNVVVDVNGVTDTYTITTFNTPNSMDF